MSVQRERRDTFARAEPRVVIQAWIPPRRNSLQISGLLIGQRGG